VRGICNFADVGALLHMSAISMGVALE